MKFTGERCIVGASDFITEKQHFDRYKFVLNYVKGKKVLDIACGSGFGTYIIAGVARKVIGVDIDKDAIEFAESNYHKENIMYCVGDATNLRNFNDESFDVIVSFETIEHIEQYEKYLYEMKRLLKQDGLLIISTPNKIFSSPNSEKPLNPFHFKEFMYEEFEGLLKKFFNNIQIIGQDYVSNRVKLQTKIAKIVPKIIKKRVIPISIRNKYKEMLSTGFTAKDPNECRFLIAVCKEKDC